MLLNRSIESFTVVFENLFVVNNVVGGLLVVALIVFHWHVRLTNRLWIERVFLQVAIVCQSLMRHGKTVWLIECRLVLRKGRYSVSFDWFSVCFLCGVYVTSRYLVVEIKIYFWVLSPGFKMLIAAISRAITFPWANAVLLAFKTFILLDLHLFVSAIFMFDLSSRLEDRDWTALERWSAMWMLMFHVLFLFDASHEISIVLLPLDWGRLRPQRTM